MWLTRLALRNPVLILMMSLMVIVLGGVSLSRLSVDLFPEINIPLIRIATFYSGAGPSDIEQSITQPIERAVSAAPGIDRVESVSKQGVSVVSAWFNYDTDIDAAQFEVAQRVAQILNSLPPGIQQPFIVKTDPTQIPVVQLAVTSSELDEKQLYDLAYNAIEPQIERLLGVASAAVGGGKTREIQILLDRDAMVARKLSPLEVIDAVKRSNLLLPSGTLKTESRDYNVFANTQFDEAKPLADLILSAKDPLEPNSGPVRLADVAEVVDGTADQTEIVRINQERGVYMRVLKQPGSNTIKVVDLVREALPNLTGVPANVTVQVNFDQSQYIRAAVSSLQHEALFGGLLAVFVILVFLVSVRATGIVAVAIPLSIVATFILLYFSGQTLNVFTLGGLALGVGRLVDDSIVELENIHRHLALGQSRREAVIAAAQEVAMPILVSTITTIVVFFPVLFLAGVGRNLFLPMALTISFALVMSFFVSRTVTPLLCLMILNPSVHAASERQGIGGHVERALDRLDTRYAKSLVWVLQHRGLTIGVILSLFAASLGLGTLIGTEFFPPSDESQFRVTYKTPIGTRLERTENVTTQLEALADDALGGVGTAYSTMVSNIGLGGGRGALYSQNTGPHAGNLNVNLVPPGDRDLTDVQAMEKVRSALSSTVAGTKMFFQTGGIVSRILNFGSEAPIDVEILGYDLEAGADYARTFSQRMTGLNAKGKPLMTDVQISREENYPELNIEVDREKAGILGLDEEQIAQTVLASLVGNTQFAPVPFTDPKTGNEYFINVRLADRFRSHVEDLNSILRTPSETMVALDTVATIERGSGPVQINRKYLQRAIDVTANIGPGQDLGSVSAALEDLIADLPPPEGFTVRLGGQTQTQRDAFAGLGFAALMAIALVYMVLASQFRSLIDPLVIMFSVPLGISGVFVMLYLTGTTLSVNSFMGIIMMVGIVVSNGVLLVDFANVLRERGHGLVEAVVEAGRTRLRPILMTTIATVVGLIPMALGLGEGSETNLPLARAVIGGLTVSTFFTLFLVPALYTVLDRFAKRRAAEPSEVEHA